MSADAEAVGRGWTCPDGSEHDWEDMAVGDRVVDRSCVRCGQLASEVR